MSVSLIIKGEPVSGKNSREIVKSRDGRLFLAKSRKALAYEASVKAQVRRLPAMLAGRLRVTATLYYASERADLDAELIFDALQKRIYLNDRQLRVKLLTHAIDKANPRAELLFECVDQLELDGGPKVRRARVDAAMEGSPA